MRPHGHARVDSQHPSAFGVCDLCGRLFNLKNLYWLYDWAGPSLINKRLRVCKQDLDKPQEQLRTKAVQADPVPVNQPRPENFTAEMGPQPAPVQVVTFIEFNGVES